MDGVVYLVHLGFRVPLLIWGIVARAFETIVGQLFVGGVLRLSFWHWDLCIKFGRLLVC